MSTFKNGSTHLLRRASLSRSGSKNDVVEAQALTLALSVDSFLQILATLVNLVFLCSYFLFILYFDRY